MKELSELLAEIAELENSKSLIDNTIKEKRNTLMDLIEKNEIKTYKDDVATLSYVQRKSVKYENKADILYRLKEEGLEKYIETKEDIGKNLEKDIKDGKFTFKGVSIETKEYPQIRFNK